MWGRVKPHGQAGNAGPGALVLGSIEMSNLSPGFGGFGFLGSVSRQETKGRRPRSEGLYQMPKAAGGISWCELWSIIPGPHRGSRRHHRRSPE